MNVRHRCAALATAVLFSSTLMIGGGAPTSASVDAEIFSFETSPGMVRTNLIVDAMDFDPVSGMLFAVTGDRDGPDARLVVVDIDAVDVVNETRFVVEDADVINIDVSRDGRTVFVSTSVGVHSFDATTLNELRFVPILFLFAGPVEASPDDPDRFLHTDSAGDGFVLDAGVVRPLRTIQDVGGGTARVTAPFAWGRDSDTVFAAGNGEMSRISVADLPVRQGFEPIERGENPVQLTYQDGRLLYEGVVYDIDTLDEVARLSGRRFPTSEGSGDVVVHSDVGPMIEWRSYDLDRPEAPLYEWTLPTGSRIVSWATTTPDRFVAVEPLPSRDNGYLMIGDLRRLATGHGDFTPVAPSRVLDTRSGLGRAGTVGKLTAGAEVSVPIAGRGGLPTEGVHAVVMNATVSAPTATSFFSIWPSGTDRPTVSNLNFGPGQALANSVTVIVGSDGAINVSNEFGRAHAVLDVVGYYGDDTADRAARYTPVRTTRLVDTRPTDFVVGTALRAGQTRTFSVGDVVRTTDLGVGRDIVGAALNVTAVRPSESGYLTVWPGGTARPTASSLNFAAGDVRANLVVVGVGDNDEVSIYNPFGSVDVLVDVFGVYETFGEPRLDQQGKFLGGQPFRIFDSRVNSPFGAPGSLEENNSLILRNYFGWTDIWNVTAVRPTSGGFLSVLPYNSDSPNLDFPSTSNVNFRAGETVANAVYAPGGPDTEIYNPFGRTHVVIDVFGFLTPEFQRPVEQVWAQPAKPTDDVSVSRSRGPASL